MILFIGSFTEIVLIIFLVKVVKSDEVWSVIQKFSILPTTLQLHSRLNL